VVDKIQEENLKRYAIENRKIARESSELCEVFQKNKLSVETKQEILKGMINDFKNALYVETIPV